MQLSDSDRNIIRPDWRNRINCWASSNPLGTGPFDCFAYTTLQLWFTAGKWQSVKRVRSDTRRTKSWNQWDNLLKFQSQQITFQSPRPILQLVISIKFRIFRGGSRLKWLILQPSKFYFMFFLGGLAVQDIKSKSPLFKLFNYPTTPPFCNWLLLHFRFILIFIQLHHDHQVFAGNTDFLIYFR